MIPPDTPKRSVLEAFLMNPAFVREFAAMHAANVNLQAGDSVHAVLLNMRLYGQWAEFIDAVVAHELGHVWLISQGYSATQFRSEADSCVSVTAANAVQHPLIRREQQRRGIPYLPYWLSKLETQLAFLRRAPTPIGPRLSTCQQLVALAEWADARLELTSDLWAQWKEFEEQMQRHFPGAEDWIDDLVGLVRGRDLAEASVYRRTLAQVEEYLSKIFQRLSWGP